MEFVRVIKVKHEETLRRFNARIVDGELELNLDALREKIIGLFKFPPDTELILTYLDEDNDLVTLGDDDDLRDVVRQSLNPLRVYVKLSSERSGTDSARTSGTTTPLRSPRVQHPSQSFDSSVLETLKSVPEPIRQTIMKIWTDLKLNGSPSGRTLNDLVQIFSTMGFPYLNQLSEAASQAAAQVVKNTFAEVQAAAQFSGASSQDTEAPKVEEAASDVIPNMGSENPPRKGKDVLLSSGSKGSEPKRDREKVIMKALGKSGSPLSNEKGVDSSSFSVPPVTVAVTGDKESLDKPSQSNGTNPFNAYAAPSYPPATSMWSNLIDSNGRRKDLFQSGFGGTLGSGFNMDERPFCGVPLVKSSAASPLSAQVVQKERGSNLHTDGWGRTVFHRGVRCDGCGVHPITGPRFKSKVKDDYDLCSICFSQMGNENDYIRMDQPVTYRHPYSFKNLHNAHHRVNTSTQPPVFRYGGMKLVRPKLDSRFIQDVNILDGTIMAPSTPFTKIWRMRNNGSIVWPQGAQLVWIGGDKLSDAYSVAIEIPPAGLAVDEELDVAVDFVAPDRPGRYISYWRMASPSGQKFGQRVWVLIQVDAASNEMPQEGFSYFNLNLPPVGIGASGPEIINVNPEPMVEDSLPEGDNSNGIARLVEPKVDAILLEPFVAAFSPEKEQEVNFPINDTLLVGDGPVSKRVPKEPSSSAFYPIIDLSVLPPVVTPVTAMQTSAEDVKGKADVEETLAKDLEEMGFKQVDLNKEILRLNEYDLEKSVDDLCGVPGWDPILEELQEMGFWDKATNFKLLQKNNGSIKRVVMDLLAGEQ